MLDFGVPECMGHHSKSSNPKRSSSVVSTSCKELTEPNRDSNRNLVPNQFNRFHTGPLTKTPLNPPEMPTPTEVGANTTSEKKRAQRSIAPKGKRNLAVSGQTPLPSTTRPPLAETKGNFAAQGPEAISPSTVCKSDEIHTANNFDTAFSPLPLLTDTAEAAPAPSNRMEHV
jgi:hypothetical protein